MCWQELFFNTLIDWLIDSFIHPSIHPSIHSHPLTHSHKNFTVFSFQELFPNTSHLPTFSSPAIESHLHRILKFISCPSCPRPTTAYSTVVWPKTSFIHSFIHPSILLCSVGRRYSIIRLFINSFIHPSIHSFFHSSIHPINQPFIHFTVLCWHDF